MAASFCAAQGLEQTSCLLYGPSQQRGEGAHRQGASQDFGNLLPRAPFGIIKRERKGMASQDLKQKDKLYSGFMGTLKWVIPLIAIIVFFVLVLIAG
ncbi:MAG: hypothetical protein AAFZ11_01160 [Pseudomonadota bacterium]